MSSFDRRSVCRRLKRELTDLAVDPKNTEQQIWGDLVDPDTPDLFKWRAFIKGPPDTPYEGGLFQLAVQISERYPYDPPEVKFVTKVWHPNVSSVTGVICLDVLKSEWSPALTLRTILLSIQTLLQAPEPDDPQDAVVANMYKKDIEVFNARVREWVKLYATGGMSEEQSSSLKSLVDMGFDRDVACDILTQCNWDIEAALVKLLG